jgi:hypothetical protein
MRNDILRSFYTHVAARDYKRALKLAMQEESFFGDAERLTIEAIRLKLQLEKVLSPETDNYYI